MEATPVDTSSATRAPEYTPGTASDAPLEASAEPRAKSMLDPALLEWVVAEPRAFEFFHAVHLLERLRAERAPVGGFADPREEVLRFRTATSVAFPANEIQSLVGDDRGAPQTMTVNFLGLTGPQGALPLPYSLYLAERARAGDHALKDFLGIFDHRIISLFYRAWEKSHFGTAFARGDEQRDWFTRHLLHLVGLGTTGLQDRLALPDEVLLAYAGLLALPTRPAAALEQIIGDYFGVAVEVEQFIGAWYPLERPTQSELGDETSPSAQLGFGAVAGDEIWDQQSKVRVRIGPLDRERYDDFLPTGSAHEPLAAICRFFANDQIDFEIQLVLARDEVPSFQLGAAETLPLSWCTWLRTSPLTRDPDDTVLTL